MSTIKLVTVLLLAALAGVSSLAKAQTCDCPAPCLSQYLASNITLDDGAPETAITFIPSPLAKRCSLMTAVVVGSGSVLNGIQTNQSGTIRLKSTFRVQNKGPLPVTVVFKIQVNGFLSATPYQLTVAPFSFDWFNGDGIVDVGASPFLVQWMVATQSLAGPVIIGGSSHILLEFYPIRMS